MNALVPPFILFTLSLIIFALLLGLVGVHTMFAAWAADLARLSARARVMAPLAVAGFLAVWVALGLVLGDPANFPLVDNNARRLLSLAVGFGPLLFAVALLATSSTVRALNRAMPPDWLIRVQVYRIAGFMFLYPLLYFGAVPAGFALPAAIGDVATGIMAPFIASAVQNRRPHAFTWAIVWNLFGILDLIVAPTAAILSRAQVLALYPISLVPLFIGPPLGILTHIYCLRNLQIAGRHEPVFVTQTASASAPTGGAHR
jgi:hypothetical protein